MFDIIRTSLAAEQLGIPPNDVCLLAQRLGYLPAVRIDDVEYYSREAVSAMREYLDTRTEANGHVTTS